MSAAAPRYVTEMGPTGLLRVVRTDGQPLGAAPPTRTAPPAPPRAPLDVEALLRRAAQARQHQQHAGNRTGAAIDDTAPTGETLRWRRDAGGLSQYELAEAAGVSRSAVAEIEQGRRNGVRAREAMGQALDALGAPRREEIVV